MIKHPKLIAWYYVYFMLPILNATDKQANIIRRQSGNMLPV